eukprot:TRINITY_DN2010_c0_g1_i1.p1 TRINITY_DN2010_c0_g1~~TRINITY_DN2010_c0_g1_i1.p1  ORF type:complete len:160 (-),score=43.06 TRINITY_DN2010_c0_g1_i1:90-569(-)
MCIRDRSTGQLSDNMGRRGGASRPAPSRGMSTAPAARAPPPRAAPPPATRSAAPAPAQPQAGGGMMAGMAANVASVAAGSVIGHGISNMMFGSGSQQQAPAEAAPPAESAYAQPAATGADACKFEFENFMQCLKGNNNDATQCQYFMDSLNTCRTNAGM